jgi:Mce-associated membrane protein
VTAATSKEATDVEATTELESTNETANETMVVTPPADSKPEARRPWPTVVLAAVVVLLAAVVVVAGLQWRTAAQTEQARTDGLAAAVDLTPKLLTFDYRTLPVEVGQAQATTTGDFAKEYSTLVQQYLTPNAMKQQFVTQVTVRDKAVVSAEPGKLVAMLYLSQVTTSATLTAPRLDNSSVRVTLTEVGGQWLVAGLERV